MNYFKRTKFEGFTQIVLCIFGIIVWASLHSKKTTWFRLFGIGLMWKHQDEIIRFSERYRYTKYIKLGNWIIEYLPYY